MTQIPDFTTVPFEAEPVVRQAEGEADLKPAGVDGFLYQGVDAVAMLQRLHAVLEVGP